MMNGFKNIVDDCNGGQIHVWIEHRVFAGILSRMLYNVFEKIRVVNSVEIAGRAVDDANIIGTENIK